METQAPNLQELKAEVENWSTKIDELNARVANVDAEMKAGYLDMVEKLNQRIEAFQTRVKDIEQRAEERLEKGRGRLRKAVGGS